MAVQKDRHRTGGEEAGGVLDHLGRWWDLIPNQIGDNGGLLKQEDKTSLRHQGKGHMETPEGSGTCGKGRLQTRHQKTCFNHVLWSLKSVTKQTVA